jgi:hypothetical protein
MEYYKGLVHIEESKKMTKEQVLEAVKSGLNEDFEVFYKGLQKANGTYESTSKNSKPNKKP